MLHKTEEKYKFKKFHADGGLHRAKPKVVMKILQHNTALTA